MNNNLQKILVLRQNIDGTSLYSLLKKECQDLKSVLINLDDERLFMYTPPTRTSDDRFYYLGRKTADVKDFLICNLNFNGYSAMSMIKLYPDYPYIPDKNGQLKDDLKDYYGLELVTFGYGVEDVLADHYFKNTLITDKQLPIFPQLLKIIDYWHKSDNNKYELCKDAISFARESQH